MKNILCFGDSNTWGYNPLNKERYPEGVRWTSRLSERLGENINIIEEGLCGRTSIYNDLVRPGRRGLDSIPELFEKYNDIDTVIIMLGTNDCKKFFNTNAKRIAKGIEKCIDKVLEHINADNVLLVSPIHLGEEVWKDEFDPDFDINSVEVSKNLKKEYQRIANKKKINFLAASDYAWPSEEDQEHLDMEGHFLLANAVYNKIMLMNRKIA